MVLGRLKVLNRQLRRVAPLILRSKAAMEPSSKRIRTGHLHPRDDELPGSRLADWLLQEFAWGNISAIAIQKVAQLALEDARGKRLQELDSLARAGCGGKYTNNILRDIWTITKSLPKLPPACLMSLQRAPQHDALDPQLTSEQGSTYSLMLPHEVFAHIWQHYPNTWSQIVCPSTVDLKKFWATAKHLPQFSSHIIHDQGGQLHQFIPIAFHGDGTPITGRGTRTPALGNFSYFFAPEC